MGLTAITVEQTKQSPDFAALLLLKSWPLVVLALHFNLECDLKSARRQGSSHLRRQVSNCCLSHLVIYDHAATVIRSLKTQIMAEQHFVYRDTLGSNIDL